MNCVAAGCESTAGTSAAGGGSCAVWQPGHQYTRRSRLSARSTRTVAAPIAALTVAAVDEQRFAGVDGSQAARRLDAVADHRRGPLHDPLALLVGQLGNGRPRVQPTDVEGLAAEHVADPGGDVRIEQDVPDRRVAVGVVQQPLDAGVDVGVPDRDVGPAPAERRVALGVELPVGLQLGRPEAHRHPARDGDRQVRLGRGAAPRLAVAVDVPRPTEAHPGVQDEAVVPDHIDHSAATPHMLDHPADAGGGPSTAVASKRTTARPTSAVRSAEATWCGPAKRERAPSGTVAMLRGPEDAEMADHCASARNGVVAER